MPIIDESLAWGRVVIHYTTDFADHTFAFHCREMDEGGNWTIPYLLEANVIDTVEKLLETLAATIPSSAEFSTFQVYKNNTSPTPTELWLIGTVPTLDPLPSASNNAGVTITLNLATALNRPAKFVICDTSGASIPPLRVLPSAFDATQTSWFDYLRNNTNIVTIDGQNISVAKSIIVSQNDKLTKAYALEANTVT